ncbi:MAG TPA: mannosyltransferase family protein [Pyrinomonadaceae bacterium]|jgi:Gpi18-like mannosyltransferase|nr:mannosyltransferase family protein [Pyrinomonadaceae bacterium]
MKNKNTGPHQSNSRENQFKTAAKWIDRRILLTVLTIKMIVLIFGAEAFVTTANERISLAGWLSIWNRFDAPHYLDIARHGYVSQGVESRWIVFYPLYPWLVRASALVLRDALVSAFFISTIASIVAALLLYKLAKLDEEDTIARAAVFFLFIFPTSYFLHIGYTESLFLALAIGAFLAARIRRWWLVGLLGALACLTRVNGLILVPALVLDAADDYRTNGRRWCWEWLWIATPLAGVLVYLLINFKVHGDALAFLRIQNAYWSKSIAWPWVGVKNILISASWRSPSEAQMASVQEFLFVVIGILLTIYSWLLLRKSYALWMTLNLLLFTSTRFILSVPRYSLVMFPGFILFARLSAARPVWKVALTVWSILFMGLFVTRFVQGLWAF